MLGFAIHTASPQLGLRLQSIDRSPAVEKQQVWDLGRAVSSQMHSKMMDFLRPYRWQDLSFIAVAMGPGGFTGTRVGVVAARTLAQQLDIPLFGVSTLAGIAQQSLSAQPDLAQQAIAVTLPAKRNAVFSAIYQPTAQKGLQTLTPDSVVPAEAWAATLAGWPPPLKVVSAEAGAGLADSVSGVMTEAIAQWQQGKRPRWSEVMPFYGQHPVSAST